jgi:hypothetical protein
MNIFYLDRDPTVAAQYMVDKHVVKMILESAQLLSTAHRFIDGEQYIDSSSGRKIKRWMLSDQREPVMYKATHINHPSAIWCRQSVENYLWLVDHFFALLTEYNYRYSKVHKCTDMGYLLQSPPLALKDWDATPVICAMDQKYIVSDDPVDNYRNYYRQGKTHLHKWTGRDVPSWM